MNKKSQKVRNKTGIALDIGAGTQHRPNFVSLDKLDLPTVDVVHDLEVFPYPFEDESCITIIASQVLHYIKARFILKVMDELWRIAKPECQLAISVPYGMSDLFVQDPCAENPWNEATAKYFDPEFPEYRMYCPKPWKIQFGPTYSVNGTMEVVLQKPK